MPIPAPGTYDVASQLTLLAAQADVRLQGYAARLVPVHNTAAYSAGSSATVNIQPPAGETWVVFVSAGLFFPNVAITSTWAVCQVQNYDGGSDYGTVGGVNKNAVANNIECAASASGWFRITNANYLRIWWDSDGGVVVGGHRTYSYWGWREN